MKMPAISVIIPMYNTEKFIADCLDSLIAQTFQDFEVIVVDDCSTDNGVAIVESYAPKFNGRFQLTQTEQNSGGGGYIPRNIGLSLAHGEYVYFVDADDFIVETALEILYTAATQFNSDVVYTSTFYHYNSDGNFKPISDAETKNIMQQGIEDKISVAVDDPDKNLQRILLIGGLFHMPWAKFVKRDLLIQNKIEFPTIISGGDFIWSIQVVYYAKKLLRLPIALYFYRDASSSVTRKKRTPREQISNCVSAFIMGIKALKDLSNKIDLLKQNPGYLRSAIMPFFFNCFARTFDERMKLPPQEIYEILYREFNGDPMVPFFISAIDKCQRDLLIANRRIEDLESKLKAKE